MKVKTDHVTAIRDLSCAVFQVTSPEKGPNIGFWTNKYIVGVSYNPDGSTTEISSCDLAADLIEARELLKKAIDLLEYCNENGVNDFLERTKEYAE